MQDVDEIKARSDAVALAAEMHRGASNLTRASKRPILLDAQEISYFVIDGYLQADAAKGTADTMAKIADAIHTSAAPGPMQMTGTVDKPTSNVLVMNRDAGTGAAQGESSGDPKPSPAADPEPTPERKSRGPSKAALAKAAKEAKKAERAQRKAEKAATKDSDTATVSDGEKDAPIANGVTDHVEAPLADQPPMAA